MKHDERPDVPYDVRRSVRVNVEMEGLDIIRAFKRLHDDIGASYAWLDHDLDGQKEYIVGIEVFNTKYDLMLRTGETLTGKTINPQKSYRKFGVASQYQQREVEKILAYKEVVEMVEKARDDLERILSLSKP